jgi:hypothetical protein
MATSVHIPEPLLQAVDRKAKGLKISRNKLIVRALEREVSHGSDWSPDFFPRLLETNDELAATMDQALATIRNSRRSKAPPEL